VLDRLLDGVKVGCVLTDPPYGINLDTDYSGTSGGMKGRKYRPVANDDKPFDAGFLYGYFGNVAEQFWFGADYYRRTIPDDERAGSWLVWDKRDEDPDDDTSNWDDALGSTFELCWSRQRHKRLLLRYRWTNWTSHSNEGHKREHPTEKPAAMLADILNRWAPKGCAVVDPFAGSGAHLLAAVKSGRTGYGVELDPAYVDVIVARLEAETGEKAVRLDG
jgi:DNA modification methylase